MSSEGLRPGRSVDISCSALGVLLTALANRKRFLDYARNDKGAFEKILPYFVAQSSTIFPELPDFINSIASLNCV